jgi:hypothetical protein
VHTRRDTECQVRLHRFSGLHGGGVSGDCPAATASRGRVPEDVFDLIEDEGLRAMLLDWIPPESR